MGATIAEIGAVQLGKRDARHDPRTLRYTDYADWLADAPRHAHWGHGLPFAMLGNDQYGCCVEAGFAHLAQVWGDRADHAFTPDAPEVLAAYSAITGFNPDDPSTDQGTDMLAACNYWRSTGLGGVKVDAFATLEIGSVLQFQQAIALYGGAYIGLALPLSAQSQVGGVWSVTSGPDARAGSWGGHCINLTGYDAEHVWGVTWGQIQTIDWSFIETYCDEAYVLLSHEWIAASGQSPSGLQWGKLIADLANL